MAPGLLQNRDLTYWGFQKLAHPLNGIISTQFRPVDCTSKKPLNFNPGFINQTIYGDKVETGWGWFPYKHNTVTFWSKVRPRRQGQMTVLPTLASILALLSPPVQLLG